MGSTNRTVSSLSFAAILSWASLTQAQSTATLEAAALAQRRFGIEQMRHHAYAEAAQAFERSIQIVDSPNTRLDLGRAYLALGRVASSLREFERSRDIARGRMDAGQSQYARTARTADHEANAVRARVPTVNVRFSAPPPAGSEVVINSQAVPAESVLGPMPVDPGHISLTLRGRAVSQDSQEFDIAEGSAPEIVLQVKPVGRLRIALRPLLAGVAVRLDDRDLSSSEIGSELEVTPGDHRVTVRWPEQQSPEEHTTTVELGQLREETYEAPRPAVVTPPVVIVPPKMVTRTRLNVPPLAAGAGMVALGIGAGIGGGVLWAQSDATFRQLEMSCMNNLCPTTIDLDARRSSGATLESIGVGLIAAGAALTIGGVALVGSGIAGIRETVPQVRIMPWVLPTGSAGLAGSF